MSPLITAETPLIGIEPSAILTFRDEYIDLADDDKLEAAKALSKNVFLVDEFIASEIEKGNISSSLFTKEKRAIKLHGPLPAKSIVFCSAIGKTVITSRKLYGRNHPFRFVAVWPEVLDMKKNIMICL